MIQVSVAEILVGKSTKWTNPRLFRACFKSLASRSVQNIDINVAIIKLFFKILLA